MSTVATYLTIVFGAALKEMGCADAVQTKMFRGRQMLADGGEGTQDHCPAAEDFWFRDFCKDHHAEDHHAEASGVCVIQGKSSSELKTDIDCVGFYGHWCPSDSSSESYPVQLYDDVNPVAKCVSEDSHCNRFERLHRLKASETLTNFHRFMHQQRSEGQLTLQIPTMEQMIKENGYVGEMAGQAKMKMNGLFVQRFPQKERDDDDRHLVSLRLEGALTENQVIQQKQGQHSDGTAYYYFDQCDKDSRPTVEVDLRPKETSAQSSVISDFGVFALFRPSGSLGTADAASNVDQIFTGSHNRDVPTEAVVEEPIRRITEFAISDNPKLYVPQSMASNLDGNRAIKQGDRGRDELLKLFGAQITKVGDHISLQLPKIAGSLPVLPVLSGATYEPQDHLFLEGHAFPHMWSPATECDSARGECFGYVTLGREVPCSTSSAAPSATPEAASSEKCYRLVKVYLYPGETLWLSSGVLHNDIWTRGLMSVVFGFGKANVDAELYSYKPLRFVSNLRSPPAKL